MVDAGMDLSVLLGMNYKVLMDVYLCPVSKVTVWVIVAQSKI